jgi:hypothetical protein
MTPGTIKNLRARYGDIAASASCAPATTCCHAPSAAPDLNARAAMKQDIDSAIASVREASGECPS